MAADELLGPMFLEDSGANDAQVSYFKGFGGPPDGRGPFLFDGFLWGSILLGTIKGGY